MDIVFHGKPGLKELNQTTFVNSLLVMFQLAI